MEQPSNDPSDPEHASARPARNALSELASRAAGRPLLPIAVGFAAGCTLCLHWPISIAVCLAPLAVGMVILVRAASRPAIVAALCSIGIAFGAVGAALSDSDHNLHITQPILCRISGRVAAEPNIAPHFVGVIIDIQEIQPGVSPEISARGRIAATLVGDASFIGQTLAEGDMITLDGVAEPVDSSDPTASDRDWLRIQGISLQMMVKRPDQVRIDSAHAGSPLLRWAMRLRQRCEDVLNHCLNPDDAAAVAAIFLGDRNRVAPAVASAFAATGASHLMATAGLHVGLLVLSLRWLLGVLTVPRKLAALLLIAVVWLYVGMTGGRPPVERAAIVATIYLIATVIERIPDLLSALSLAAVLLLWNQPTLLLDMGFQMSFLTVFGIVALMPELKKVWHEPVSKIHHRKLRAGAVQLLDMETLTVAAQVSSAPLVAQYFNRIAVYGIGVNLIVVPLMLVLVPLILLTLTLGLIWLPAAAVAAHWLLAPVLHGMLAIIQAAAQWPGSTLSVASPGTLWICAAYSALFGGCFVLHVIAKQAALAAGARAVTAADLSARAGVDSTATRPAAAASADRD